MAGLISNSEVPRPRYLVGPSFQTKVTRLLGFGDALAMLEYVIYFYFLNIDQYADNSKISPIYVVREMLCFRSD